MSHHNIEQKKTTADKVANFLSKNKILLWSSLAALVIITILLAVIDSNIQNRKDMYSDKSAELENEYQAWFSADEEKKDSVEEEFLSEIEEILKLEENNILVEKALFLRGQLYLSKEEWDNAYNDFNSIVENSPESYLASVSLYNGAAAKENAGLLEESLELLKSLNDNYRASSPLIPETLFSIGRLNEALGNGTDAIAAYEDLTTSFASSSWTNLAKTRIISLKASGESN